MFLSAHRELGKHLNVFFSLDYSWLGTHDVEGLTINIFQENTGSM